MAMEGIDLSAIFTGGVPASTLSHCNGIHSGECPRTCSCNQAAAFIGRVSRSGRLEMPPAEETLLQVDRLLGFGKTGKIGEIIRIRLGRASRVANRDTGMP